MTSPIHSLINAAVRCGLCSAPFGACSCWEDRAREEAAILAAVSAAEPNGIAEDQIPGTSEAILRLVEDGKLAWRGLPDEDAPMVYRIPHPVRLRGKALREAVEREIGAVGADGYAEIDLFLFFGAKVTGALRQLEMWGRARMNERRHWVATGEAGLK